LSLCILILWSANALAFATAAVISDDNRFFAL
jgi:hypothetical protein